MAHKLDMLYSDFRLEPSLEYHFDAHDKFEEYLEKLAKLSQTIKTNQAGTSLSSWQVWENGLRQFYKELILDAFKVKNIKPPEGMEIYFSGSLAKAQATEYSDLDAFVLLKNKEDIKRVEPVFLAVNNLCQRLFEATKQLYPDPLGINPARLMGTPDTLFEKLVEGDVTDLNPTLRAILTSKPILGDFKLGEELREKIRQDPEFAKVYSAKAFYEMVEQFKPPKKGASKVNIKSHIMRPIDFILMGLREEFGLYSEDGSHLSAPGTFRLLREGRCLPEKDIELIESTYNQAMHLRFNLHARKKKESDTIPRSQAEGMLKQIEKIRALSDSRLQRMKALEEAKQMWTVANDLLEKADITGYFLQAKTLHAFMNEKGLKKEDLRAELRDTNLSPKGLAVLEQFWKAAKKYNAEGGTSVERDFASEAKEESAFFTFCKLSPKKKGVKWPQPDPRVEIAPAKILIGFMQCIKDTAQPEEKIGDSSVKALMTHKIAALHKIKNSADQNAVDEILGSVGEPLSTFLYYKHATKDIGRAHRYTVTASYPLDCKYENTEGDALKTKILSYFKDTLAEATDEEDLQHIVNFLKSTHEYEILKTGQGFATSFFGLKTSSVGAFERLIKEAETVIQLKPKPNEP